MKKEHKFKKGEWCFFEFELHQIKKLHAGRISEVSTGIVTQASYDLYDRCFPLNADIKIKSDQVALWKSKIKALEANSLNWPDIHEEFTRIWMELCNITPKALKTATVYQELADFSNSIIKQVENMRYEKANGVKIFR